MPPVLSSRVRSTRLSPRRAIQALFLAIAMLVPALTNGMIGATAAPLPTLATDKPDYQSGETVHITGSGYDAGATYAIPVRRPDSSILKGDGSFTPGWDTVTADGAGNIAYDYQLDGIAGLYEARTYPNPWSGNWAQAPLASVTFTDALTVNLDQCANLTPPMTPCVWQNGSLNQNNSAYAEGEVVPFRLAIEGLPPGPHTIHINYDFTSGGHEAYDFLATYNVTETDADLCRPGGGGLSSLCPTLGAPLPVNFPTDSFTVTVPDANNLSVSGAELPQAQRQLFVFGAQSASIVAPPVHAGPTGGNSTADITVNFSTMGPSSAVLLAWGGHLAASSYWIEGMAPDGAGQINGAPWHMRTQQLDGSGNKNQDRSIQPSAIVPPPQMGSITIIKDTVPDDPQDFNFVTSGTGLSDFVLDDDGNEDVAPFSSQTFDVLPGQYTVRENLALLPPNFSLFSLVCTDQSLPPDTVVDLGTGLATINLSANETVVCTYTNTKAAPTGRLVIEKDTIPDGPTPFTFTPTGFNSGSTFVLDDAASTPTIPNSMGFTVPAAMPLTVTETTVTGFVLSSIVCRDANGVLVPANRVSVSIPAVTVTVLENEVVTCVFTNRQQGRIIIHKDTVPNDPQDFRFETTGDGLSPFILEDDGNELVAPFNTQTFNVLPGQFSVREVLPVPGFTLASLRCSDPSGGTTTNLATGLATIGLAAGETVECFFVNTKQQPPAYGTDPKALPTERPYDPVTNGQPAGDTGQTGGAQNQPSPEPTTSQDPAAEVAGTTDALSPVADPSGGPGDSVVDTVVDPIVDAVKSQINLPRTGAELIQQAIAGLVLIGGGLVLMALRRRRSSASA